MEGLHCHWLSRWSIINDNVSRTPVPIVDIQGRIITVLGGSPDDATWLNVHQQAAQEIESSRDRCHFTKKLVVVGHCICMAGTSLNLLVGLVFEGPVSRLKNIATRLDQDQKRLDILHAVMSPFLSKTNSLLAQNLVTNFTWC